MHIVTVTQALTRGSRLPVGSYLVDSVNAGELLAANPTKITAQHIPNLRPLDSLGLDELRADVPRVLIIRTGGYGDLLFLAAAIREFKSRNPTVHIAVATFTEYAAVFTNNPDVA